METISTYFKNLLTCISTFFEKCICCKEGSVIVDGDTLQNSNNNKNNIEIDNQYMDKV